MPQITFGVASDRGSVRAVNEDSAVVAGTCAAVADGMGGYAGGDVASRIAVECIEECAASGLPLRAETLESAIRRANGRILDAASKGEGRSGMGTTLAGVGAALIGGTHHWIVFNVGDSRVYRWDAVTLQQVSVDHSVVEELVAAGLVATAEKKTDPRRHILTRALGSDPAPEVDIWLIPANPGDRFVICSDGLNTEMADDQIRDVLVREADPQRAADTLVRQAVAAGGRDNVTVIVVDHAPTYEPSPSTVTTQPRNLRVQGGGL